MGISNTILQVSQSKVGCCYHHRQEYKLPDECRLLPLCASTFLLKQLTTVYVTPDFNIARHREDRQIHGDESTAT